MIKFVPILIDVQNNRFENHQYLPFILSQFNKYKHILADDYYPKDDRELVKYIVDEINALYPWFMIGFVNDKPIGVVWVSHWHGNYSKYHSCQIHSFIDKKYWGKTAKKATNEFLSLLFNNYGVERIQMEIPDFNHKAIGFAKRLGFVKEGVIRCATLKGNKPVNNILFSKLKGEHSNGKR